VPPAPIDQAAESADAELSRERLALATRGLVHMGFRETEARRALEVIAARHSPNIARPVDEILREALAVLT